MSNFKIPRFFWKKREIKTSSRPLQSVLVVEILRLCGKHSRGTFLKDVVIVLEQILVRRQ